MLINYVMSVWPHCPVQCRQASGEEPEEKENPFELFAETEILAEDCLGTRGPDNLPPKSQFRRTSRRGSLFLPALRHRANGMATERHQSGGTMRRRLDDVFSMDRRASVRAEDGPGRMMRGPKRLGSTTGFSGAKFAQKTRERLRRRMLRSSEDLLSKKGRCERWKFVDPIFVKFSLTCKFPTHQILWVHASQGDVEKASKLCFLFLATQHKILELVPTQNSGMLLNHFLWCTFGWLGWFHTDPLLWDVWDVVGLRVACE